MPPPSTPPKTPVGDECRGRRRAMVRARCCAGALAPPPDEARRWHAAITARNAREFAFPPTSGSAPAGAARGARRPAAPAATSGARPQRAPCGPLGASSSLVPCRQPRVCCCPAFCSPLPSSAMAGPPCSPPFSCHPSPPSRPSPVLPPRVARRPPARRRLPHCPTSSARARPRVHPQAVPPQRPRVDSARPRRRLLGRRPRRRLLGRRPLRRHLPPVPLRARRLPPAMRRPRHQPRAARPW
jgi:hypothetical protein